MIRRVAEEKLRALAATFKAVALTGPRQSGKTTLSKAVFQNKPYVSLAGRVAHLFLLPFSVTELTQTDQLPATDNDLLLTGFYPPIYDQQIPPTDWCLNYIRTYVERDVRQLKNITDLLVFERFMGLLAGRCGQELNLSALSVEAGVDVKTVQAWVGVLESSFIIFLLKPHYQNFNKTIVKRPKLYFYDTGLVCSLLRITQPDQLVNHPLRGALFETMVIAELVKQRTNAGLPINLFYWRDKTGHEVDIIVDEAGKLTPIEIKSGQTVQPEFFKNLTFWNKLSGSQEGYVLYGGHQTQQRSNGITVMNWREMV